MELVPVARLTALADSFRCVPYKVDLSAGSCLRRQVISVDPKDARRHYMKLCEKCVLGRDVRTVIASLGIEPTVGQTQKKSPFQIGKGHPVLPQLPETPMTRLAPRMCTYPGKGGACPRPAATLETTHTLAHPEIKDYCPPHRNGALLALKAKPKTPKTPKPAAPIDVRTPLAELVGREEVPAPPAPPVAGFHAVKDESLEVLLDAFRVVEVLGTDAVRSLLAARAAPHRPTELALVRLSELVQARKLINELGPELERALLAFLTIPPEKP